MANVYGVKFVTISEVSTGPVLVGEKDGAPVHSDKVRVSKEGTVNVLAIDPQAAGNIAQAHLKTDGVVEVNIHLVQELAKNVIAAEPKGEASDERPQLPITAIHIPEANIERDANGTITGVVLPENATTVAHVPEPDVTTHLQAGAASAQEQANESAPGL